MEFLKTFIKKIILIDIFFKSENRVLISQIHKHIKINNIKLI